jgi:2-oxoglutarate ferredoxin oxidoreductase subunit alpha
MSLPELWGSPDADLTIMSWGSTAPTVREAIGRLGAASHTVNSLEFSHLFPMKIPETQELLERNDTTTLMVEGNYTGQFAHLLRAETGYRPDFMLTKYDGEPFEAREIVARAVQVIKDGT